ncbi:MAG: hypothetical protein R3A79_08205 [Nannocystaceae bacterium]
MLRRLRARLRRVLRPDWAAVAEATASDDTRAQARAGEREGRGEPAEARDVFEPRIPHLLRAVALAPLDDAPLLELAEHVDPHWRAAILAGVELTALLRAGAWRGEPAGLAEATLAIAWNKHRFGARYDLALAPALGRSGSVVSRRRGVVDGVSLPAAQLVAFGRQLRRLRPITHVELSAAGQHMDELAASEVLEGIRSLSLARGGVDDAGLLGLVRASRLRELRWLDLRGNAITDAGIEALAASEALPQLRWVELGHNPCVDPTPHLEWEESFDWGPTPCHIAAPERGRELVGRYGARAWITDAPLCRDKLELIRPLPAQRYAWLP